MNRNIKKKLLDELHFVVDKKDKNYAGKLIEEIKKLFA